MNTARTFRCLLVRQAALTTTRLVMRRPVEADIPAIVEQANDWDVARLLGRVPHPYGVADARFFLDHVVVNELTWAITLRTDATFIGVIGLHPKAEPGAFELGYWLGRRHWGRGFATEAGSAVVEHAFGTLGLATLVSGHFVDNRPSGRVLTKLGFAKTGSGERPCLAQGKLLPSVEMELVRSSVASIRQTPIDQP